MTATQTPNPATEIDAETLAQLVALFGQVDALWWPFRTLKNREPLQAVMERRSEYKHFGLHFSIESDGSASGWKRAQRQRKALAATKHVTLQTFQRTPRLKFTPEGDAFMRDLLHLTDLLESADLLAKLESYPDHNCKRLANGDEIGADDFLVIEELNWTKDQFEREVRRIKSIHGLQAVAGSPADLEADQAALEKLELETFERVEQIEAEIDELARELRAVQRPNGCENCRESATGP